MEVAVSAQVPGRPQHADRRTWRALGGCRKRFPLLWLPLLRARWWVSDDEEHGNDAAGGTRRGDKARDHPPEPRRTERYSERERHGERHGERHLLSLPVALRKSVPHAGGLEAVLDSYPDLDIRLLAGAEGGRNLRRGVRHSRKRCVICFRSVDRH